MAYPPQIDEDDTTTEMLVPTAPTVLNLVHDTIVTDLRRGHSARVELPSLYRLAHMVHYGTSELVVSKQLERK